jgi:copper chaperone CopZ
MKEIIWHTPDIECEGCVRSIHRALDDVDGVLQVEVDLLQKTVRVVFDPGRVQEAQLQHLLEAAGFTPSP